MRDNTEIRGPEQHYEIDVSMKWGNVQTAQSLLDEELLKRPLLSDQELRDIILRGR